MVNINSNSIKMADSSSPDLNQNREKKKRMKKRRQPRKNFGKFIIA